MKVPLNWINELVPVGKDPQAIADVLTQRGLACEAIYPFGDDWVLDVEVTSNRGDCLGLVGIARELASAMSLPLTIPEPKLLEHPPEVSSLVSIEIREPQLCGRYTARVIQGVAVGPSPSWLVERLEAVGIRSVCNVVDATNYAMIETGQPPHAFDLAKISGARIVVRRAAAGESLVSIDQTLCRLDPNTLVIADLGGPIAVAGVMGGKATEVSESTTSILLEDAFFDPVCVRSAARRLGLESEAAHRFGRTVDIEQIEWASRRTVELILQVAGGRLAKGVIDVYPCPPGTREVRLRPARLDQLLGLHVPVSEAVAILEGLGFGPRHYDGEVVCSVPSWRADVSREVDLIEEVARCYGYDKVPTRPTIQIRAAAPDRRRQVISSMTQALHGCGYYEAITVDLVDAKVSDLFAPGQPVLRLRESFGGTGQVLRRTLLGSVVAALRTNLHAKNRPCRLYEIAPTFVPNMPGQLPRERTTLALVADGDTRHMRAAIEAAIGRAVPAATVDVLIRAQPWAQIGADVAVNDRVVGCMGVLSKQVAEVLDLGNCQPICAEIDLDAVMDMMTQTRLRLLPIPRFPAIERDLSVLVDRDLPWQDIRQVVHSCALQTLEEVVFVELYLSEGVPAGKKSVTFTLRFRDPEGTLTHEQVDQYQAQIVDALACRIGAQLRGPQG